MKAAERTLPRWPWLAVPLLVAVELVAQWAVPRGEPADEDWQAAAQAIAAEKRDDDLVVIAPDWAVQGRVHLGELISRGDLGRFDTDRYDRLLEVSLRGARAPEADGLAPESEKNLGELVLRRYQLPSRVRVVHDLLANTAGCSAEGFPAPRVEFLVDRDFAPRLVARVPLRDRPVALTCPDVPLDGTLRLYGIVDYITGRFERGPAVRVQVSADGQLVGEAQIDDRDPVRPHDMPLPGGGDGAVRIEISSPGGHDRLFGIAADIRQPRGER